MDENTKNSPCEECNEDSEGRLLHAEVEHLRKHLAARDSHIVTLEGEYIKCTTRANDLDEQLNTWQEKYERLYDSYKRVQKLNQGLEEKLLQMVDKMKSEKSQLTKDIATLSVRLAESKHNYSMLQKENERYKNDMNLAIQLLQCKPDNFVSQKLDNLPSDTQARVSQYVMSKTPKLNSSNQSKNGNEIETFDASEYEFNISASLMSKILEDSIQDTVTKHCDTCTCNKTQNKPFCYNENCYSVATQTLVSGGGQNSLCLTCNSEMQTLHSKSAYRSNSPHSITIINDDKSNNDANMIGSLYIIPQQIDPDDNHDLGVEKNKSNCMTANNKCNIEENITIDSSFHRNFVPKVEDDAFLRQHNVNMEPAVHHKLCDRTKSSISSKKSSTRSVGHDDLLFTKNMLNVKDLKTKNDKSLDNTSIRKNSHSSMGAISRTSSVAKSTISTQKSNTQVGPGPRFCHLRMQAGSKNILLDNVEPDVPPVLYRRQSKCNENTLFKELNDDLNQFIDLNKNGGLVKDGIKNENVVVESTLIDVHIDNSNKESDNSAPKNTSINPVLLNVSSSPLQPLKTHNFSNSSEYNNNNSQSMSSQQNVTEIDNLLNDFKVENIKNNNNNSLEININNKTTDNVQMTDNHMKIFNFDIYEQNNLASQFNNKSLRKIDMSQFHSLENTKISKDLPPVGDSLLAEKKKEDVKPALPPIVNVYPNLTQTHLKVTNNKAFTNEQSTSSLSSDDSAALLQKQQLLRVAEWVEKNLEQQNNFNDELEDDVNFVNKARRESRLSRLTETLNELALNMPHPVSKYSKSYNRENHNSWVHNKLINIHEKPIKPMPGHAKITSNIIKETIFPVDCGDATVTEVSNNPNTNSHAPKDIKNKAMEESFKPKSEKEITPEDLARMEYNVKKFLLSGPNWVNPGSVVRSRRTSSKTETDV